MDLYHYDEAVRKQGFGILAGVDEAGRGPLAGPVVAAAVILPPGLRIEGVRDSKQVPLKKREALFWEIAARADDIGIGIIDASEIDRINILHATKIAMQDAIRELSIQPHLLLIDAVKLPAVQIPQRAIIKGDAQSASIAAASIVAKVIRDAIMIHYHTEYPHYGFDSHKGYGTQLHIERLMQHGPCPLHRKTFRKVMELALPFHDR